MSRSQQRFPLFPLATVTLLSVVVLSSCERGTPKIVLESRIEELQQEVEMLKRKAEDSQDYTDAASTEFKDRLAATEQKSQEALDQAAAAINQQKTRFERLENSVSSVLRIKEESETMAYLSPDKEGHRTIQTGHGPFLVRLLGIERDPLQSRFVAKLSIGNPNGLLIQEFTLKGDFGSKAPELKPAEPYSEFSERLDAWQQTLTPFQEAFVVDLPSNAWTPVDLPLNASGEAALQLMRFTMVIRRAHLEGEAGESEYSVINADSQGASLIKTDYGPFLARVDRMETEGSSTRIHLTIGNPFGFVVNEAFLKGEFGPAAPRKMDSEPTEMFRRRLEVWSRQMAPFEGMMSGSIAPLRWSQTSFSVPTNDRTLIKYIRCKMNVVNITLPKTP